MENKGNNAPEIPKRYKKKLNPEDIRQLSQAGTEEFGRLVKEKIWPPLIEQNPAKSPKKIK